MNYLQKIPLLGAFGSAAYGAYSILDFHVKCGSYSELEVSICELYKLHKQLSGLYEDITGKPSESSIPPEIIPRDLYDKSLQMSFELCTPFEKCQEMAEGVNTTLVTAGLVCTVSVLALYILSKMKQRPQRQPEVSPVQARVRRTRPGPSFQPSASSSRPAAPPSTSSSSSQTYSYQREWDARRNWVGNGADLSGIPGCKR